MDFALEKCDVMLDDIVYPTEFMLQYSVIAQAMNQVVAQGISFFSAAGNNTRRSWHAPTEFQSVFLASASNIISSVPIPVEIPFLGALPCQMPGDGHRRTFLFFSVINHSKVSAGLLDVKVILSISIFTIPLAACIMSLASTDDNISNGNPYEQFAGTSVYI